MTDREIDRLYTVLDNLRGDFVEIKESLASNSAYHEAHKEKLDDIKKQTEKTNGRVTALEKWQNRVGGALYIIPIVVSVIVTAISIAVKVNLLQ